MGDRANVFIPERGDPPTDGAAPGVFLYTHWGGYDLPLVVKAALIRGEERWDDPHYLARIVFCEMVGERVNQLTGYGISARLTDNEHPIIRLDTDAQTISWDGTTSGSWSFQDFVGLTDEQIETAWLGHSDDK